MQKQLKVKNPAPRAQGVLVGVMNLPATNQGEIHFLNILSAIGGGPTIVGPKNRTNLHKK
jgi:hypothetical protein